jgi:hypothetical protein
MLCVTLHRNTDCSYAEHHHIECSLCLSVTFLMAMPRVIAEYCYALCHDAISATYEEPYTTSKFVSKPKYKKYFISGKKNNSFARENSLTYCSSVKKVLLLLYQVVPSTINDENIWLSSSKKNVSSVDSIKN